MLSRALLILGGTRKPAPLLVRGPSPAPSLPRAVLLSGNTCPSGCVPALCAVDFSVDGTTSHKRQHTASLLALTELCHMMALSPVGMVTRSGQGGANILRLNGGWAASRWGAVRAG